MSSAVLQTLYHDHHHWLVNWLHRRLHCVYEAQDLAQDTFVRIMGKPQLLTQLQQPRAWLTTVAHGLLIDQLRRRVLERAYIESLQHLPQALHPSPEEQHQLLDTLTRLDTMLEGLPEKARQALLLSRLEGLSYGAIAAELGVSLSSVEKYMAKALRHCLMFRLQHE